MLERDQHVGAVLFAAYRLECSVVEDVAVLVDLDERRPPVVVSTAERLDHVLAIEVVGSGDKGRLGPEGEAHGVERGVERAEGS